MTGETDGIVLRQVKIADDRRILTILTRDKGKISAGTSIRTNGKNRSSLAIRPFTHGRYMIFAGRNSYSVDRAETIESFYNIGEDVDKYMSASYVLELTDKMVGEGTESSEMLDLLLEFMRLMMSRKKDIHTLVIVYKWKLLGICGYAPSLRACSCCGKEGDDSVFSIIDGGIICNECKNSKPVNMRLLYDLKFDIIQTLKYIYVSPMKSFEKLTLARDIAEMTDEIFREYISYHLDIKNIKSEAYLNI